MESSTREGDPQLSRVEQAKPDARAGVKELFGVSKLCMPPGNGGGKVREDGEFFALVQEWSCFLCTAQDFLFNVE